jgi:hypothetical protein
MPAEAAPGERSPEPAARAADHGPDGAPDREPDGEVGREPGSEPSSDLGSDLGSDPDISGGEPPAGRASALRRRPLLAGGCAVLALAMLAGVGDVLIERTARHRIVAAATCRLKPVGHVSAQLSGSMAGLRMLTGEVGTVRIRAQDVERDGTRLSVAAEVRGVTTKGGSSGGSAVATIPYDQVSERLGGGIAGLRPRADGPHGLALTGTLAGIPLPVTVRARISASGQELTVTPTDVAILGEDFTVDRLSSSPRTAALAGSLGPRTVPVPELPSGVSFTAFTAASDGLRLSLAISRSAVAHHTRGCSR